MKFSRKTKKQRSRLIWKIPIDERVEPSQELEQEEISPRQNTQQVLLTDSKAEIEADSPPTVKISKKRERQM
ncbi:MAG: hypothetical protein HC820_08030 [Hydrococcus sp. RM1_1_31]|nr:hypothetical protein [Hydrococcus sp. RM1_1_31]